MEAEAGAVGVVGRGIPSGGETFTRGLNDARLAMLGILVAIALGAAALAPGWWRLLAGLGAFAASCALIKWPRSRHGLMSFIHWLTDL